MLLNQLFVVVRVGVVGGGVFVDVGGVGGVAVVALVDVVVDVVDVVDVVVADFVVLLLFLGCHLQYWQFI